MTASLVFAIVGADRAGLVEELADLVAEHGGNWLDSRMSVLAGAFGGIVQVEVPEEQAEPLRRRLLDLEARGLRVLVETAEGEPSAFADRSIVLELQGRDRRGLLRDVARSLHARGINIVDLVTELGDEAGDTGFRLVAELHVPREVDLGALERELGALEPGATVRLEGEETGGAQGGP